MLELIGFGTIALAFVAGIVFLLHRFAPAHSASMQTLFGVLGLAVGLFGILLAIPPVTRLTDRYLANKIEKPSPFVWESPTGEDRKTTYVAITEEMEVHARTGDKDAMTRVWEQIDSLLRIYKSDPDSHAAIGYLVVAYSLHLQGNRDAASKNVELAFHGKLVKESPYFPALALYKFVLTGKGSLRLLAQEFGTREEQILPPNGGPIMKVGQAIREAYAKQLVDGFKNTNQFMLILNDSRGRGRSNGVQLADIVRDKIAEFVGIPRNQIRTRNGRDNVADRVYLVHRDDTNYDLAQLIESMVFRRAPVRASISDRRRGTQEQEVVRAFRDDPNLALVIRLPDDPGLVEERMPAFQ